MTLRSSGLPHVWQALGYPLAELTESQERLLDILLDPQNHDLGDQEQRADGAVNPALLIELLDDYAQFNTVPGRRQFEIQKIADILHEHYDRADRNNAGRSSGTPFTFSWGGDNPSDLSGYEISVYLGREFGCHLLQYRALDLLCDNNSGLRFALHVAEQIDNDYRRVLRKAMEHNLLPALTDDLDSELNQIWNQAT